jgi:hypothetical protein
MGAEATSKSESQNFPSEGGPHRAVTPSAKLAGQLVWASAQVMRAHDFTPDRRIEEAIQEALGLWCSKLGRTVEEAVALEANNFRVYQQRSDLMTHAWGWRWWFKKGYWLKPGLWPYDQQKLAQVRNANIGRNPDESQEGGP